MCSPKVISSSTRAHTRLHFPGSSAVRYVHVLGFWPVEFPPCPLKLPHKNLLYTILYFLYTFQLSEKETPLRQPCKSQVDKSRTTKLKEPESMNHHLEESHPTRNICIIRLWRLQEICIKPLRYRALSVTGTPLTNTACAQVQCCLHLAIEEM